jgi:hypothetical protein
MKEIPKKLQCAYCIRNCTHGGECTAKRSPYDESGCLIFKADEKGCIRNKDLKIPVALYNEIPIVDRWCDNYTLCGVETELRIRRIHYLSWDKHSGYLYIHCNCDYYVNEFHEDYTEPKDKTILKVIK